VFDRLGHQTEVHGRWWCGRLCDGGAGGTAFERRRGGQGLMAARARQPHLRLSLAVGHGADAAREARSPSSSAAQLGRSGTYLPLHLFEETNPMPWLRCADLISSCDTTVEGATDRYVLLGYIGHADRAHRQDAIPLNAVLGAISNSCLLLTAAVQS
jgi:predicted small metal-binding protein